MNPSLVFRFSGPDRVEWCLPQQQVPTLTTLTTLATQADSRHSLLVLPGETVLLTRARLPGRQHSTWLKAVPYAVEEHLAEDVDDLHFALSPRATEDTIAVAVIRQQTLQAQLSACTEAGLTPLAVMPDTLLLPLSAGRWSVLLEPDRAVVRCGLYEGFACERDNLSLLLTLALNEADEQRPKGLDVWGDIPPELRELNVEIQPQNPQAHALSVFATGHQDKVLNLLQGRYSRRAHIGRWLRPWRAAAILAGLWLGLQVALQASDYWSLSRERAALTSAMEQTYRKAVPDARRIVNPRAQLENRLRALRSGGGQSQATFLDLLYRGGRQLLALEGLMDTITLRGLRYNNGQLDVDLAGGSLEIFDRLKEQLKNQPDLSAQVRTTKREGRVESRLTLTGNASS